MYKNTNLSKTKQTRERCVIEDKKRGVQYSGQERDSIEGTGGLS